MKHYKPLVSGVSVQEHWFACTHGVVGGLDAAEGGAFLHHEAEQTCEDGGYGPRGVPRIWMKVCDGQT